MPEGLAGRGFLSYIRVVGNGCVYHGIEEPSGTRVAHGKGEQMRAIGKSEFVESGRRARLAGIAAKDCPLAIGSEARKWWMEGWRTGIAMDRFRRALDRRRREDGRAR